MATRNMVEANRNIFSRLDSFCADRQDPVSNAGSGRWIATDSYDKVFLQRSVLASKLAFSSTMRLARLDFGNHSYFVASGFEIVDIPAGLSEAPLGGGLLTAFLFEVGPSPTATTAEIRNVIEVDDIRSGPDYRGFDVVQVTELFMPIQVFVVPTVEVVDTSRVFLRLCLADRRRTGQWMDDSLTQSIRDAVMSTSVVLPFDLLCRTVLELDPSALFLMLYRFLEAIYSYTSAIALAKALLLVQDWLTISATLEDVLGWRPKEEQSIEALFEYVEEADAISLLSSLGQTLPSEAKPLQFAARQVYKLRNALVHYRPIHHSDAGQVIDWNRLCQAMVSIVFTIYARLGISLRRVSFLSNFDDEHVVISSPS